jgi:hypothetical protein
MLLVIQPFQFYCFGFETFVTLYTCSVWTQNKHFKYLFVIQHLEFYYLFAVWIEVLHTIIREKSTFEYFNVIKCDQYFITEYIFLQLNFSTKCESLTTKCNLLFSQITRARKQLFYSTLCSSNEVYATMHFAQKCWYQKKLNKKKS